MLSRIAAFGALLGTVLADGSIPVPWGLPFNNTVGHGPDGPWNFFTLNVGGGAVDFYPAYSPGSNLMVRQKACDVHGTWCLNPRPNYYVTDADNKTTFKTGTYDGGSSVTNNLTQISGTGIWEWQDNFNVPFPAKTIQNTDTEDSLFNFPIRGVPKTQYVPVSLLTLERTAAHTEVTGTSGNTIFGQYIAASKSAPAIGMTFGSVAYKMDASTTFSGYDQGKLIEDPAVFSNVGQIKLDSLSFGTDSGDSPWANAKNLPPNFVGGSAGGATGGGIKTIISPQTPYLNLPNAVCSAMATFLPVNYDADTNLYLWNTTDPAYHDIISSPSYLNFTFGGVPGASIRVPFALLNLTLEAPLKAQPTPYFPCHGTDVGPMPVALGRAFLQAAYLMQSYDPPTIAVGQAPGPKVAFGSSVQTLAASNPTVSPHPDAPRWADTWAGVLTPLQRSPASPNAGNTSSTDGSFPSSSPSSDTTATGGASAASPSSTSSNSQISPAHIAGIAVGASVGAFLLLAIPFILYFLKKRRSRPADAASLYSNPPPPPYGDSTAFAHALDTKGYYVGPGGRILPKPSAESLQSAYAGGGGGGSPGSNNSPYYYSSSLSSPPPPPPHPPVVLEMQGEGQTELQEIDGQQVRAEVGTDGQRAAELDQDHGTSWRRFTREMPRAHLPSVTRSSSSPGAPVGGGGGNVGGAGQAGRGFRQIMSDDWERYGSVLSPTR